MREAIPFCMYYIEELSNFMKDLISIINLMRRLLSGDLKTEQFCVEYENLFNFELDLRKIDTDTYSELDNLLTKTSLYSPYEEDRKIIRNYYGEREIIKFVEDVLKKVQF